MTPPRITLIPAPLTQRELEDLAKLNDAAEDGRCIELFTVGSYVKANGGPVTRVLVRHVGTMKVER